MANKRETSVIGSNHKLDSVSMFAEYMCSSRNYLFINLQALIILALSHYSVAETNNILV